MAQTAKATSADLPSITELGRILGAITRRESAIDLVVVDRDPPRDEAERLEQSREDRRCHTVDKLLYRQMEALREIVTTMPAQSLPDCAVQISVASHLVSKLTNNDLEKAEIRDLADGIERILISVLPVLAVAAGLDLIEFAFDEVTALHEVKFPELAA